ncbi:MAG: hypothetical protein ACKO42_02480 [Gammaproteobacteria bacterium]
MRLHLNLLIGLLGSLIALPSHADASLQREAEQLQRCLESQLTPWQIESTVSTEGRVTDSVRLTRFGNGPKTQCMPKSMSGQASCNTPNDLQRIVTLEFVPGEAHAAWSANDRARLEDLIPATLLRIPGSVRVQPVGSRQSKAATDVLRVRLDYRGMSAWQRDLADWVRGPRELVVTLSLVDLRQAERVVASRVLTVKQTPQILDAYAANSSTRWMTQLLEKIDASAREIISPLGCGTPWLDVTVDRGKLWMTSGQYLGLSEGRSVLLVPTADSALASRWPIARIRNLSEGSSAELEIIRGSSELCEAGCRAVPL